MKEHEAATFGRWAMKLLGYAASITVCGMAGWAAFDHLPIGWACLFALALCVFCPFLCALIGVAVDDEA